MSGQTETPATTRTDPEPTIEMTKNLIDYNPETGVCTWKPRDISFFKDGKIKAETLWKKWNTRWAGKIAFSYINPEGYQKSNLKDHPQLAHRLIWEMVVGPIPKGMQIDHINGKRSDNRISNLRLVTQAENSRNMKMLRTNTSGVTGVTLGKKMKKWRARISDSNGQRIHLGYFHTKEEALASIHPLRTLPENNYTSRHGKHEAEEDSCSQVVA